MLTVLKMLRLSEFDALCAPRTVAIVLETPTPYCNNRRHDTLCMW